MGAAALDPDEVLATIRALAGVDDPSARAALVACLDAGPVVAAAASDALAATGAAARDVCVAALGRPERVRWAARALARIGPDGAAAIALWRALPGAAAETRLAIAAALHRAPRAAPGPMGAWLRDERDDGVILVLVDTLGRLAPGDLDAATRARVGDLARTATSPFVRALATWAALRHGDRDVEPLAFELLTDPVAGPALVTYVIHRGGALSSLVAGFTPTAGLDPASEIQDGVTGGAP